MKEGKISSFFDVSNFFLFLKRNSKRKLFLSYLRYDNFVSTFIVN